MITGIEILKINPEKIEMYGLTKNTIVLFKDWKIKKLVGNILEQIKYDGTPKENEVDNIMYSTVNNPEKAYVEDHKAEIKVFIKNLNTTIYDIDKEQKIILTTEAAFLFQSKEADDIWFCIENDDEIKIYPFSDFENYKKLYEDGLFMLYKRYIENRFDL